MELRTNRLLLRPVAADDLEALLAIRNDPRVFSGTNTGAELPRDRLATTLDGWVVFWRERDLGTWLILREGEPIGWVDVNVIGDGWDVPPDEIELGVIVHPDHWGAGIAAEAGLAVAEDCFTRVGLARLYAIVNLANNRSLRALAKAPGMRRIAVKDEEELYELVNPAR